MERNKIDYGIDLGTTNSAICRMEKGVPVIQKTDTQGRRGFFPPAEAPLYTEKAF